MTDLLVALWAARDRLITMQGQGEHCVFSLSLSNDSNLYSWESTCESLHLHCDRDLIAWSQQVYNVQLCA